MASNENELSEFNGNPNLDFATSDEVQELPFVACNVDISTSSDSSACNTPTRPTPTEVQPAVAKDMFYAKRGKATPKRADRQVKPGCSKTPDEVERPSTRQLFFGSPPGRARPPQVEGADSPFKAPSPSKDWGKLYLRDKKKVTSQAESVQPSNETSCMGRSSKQAPNTQAGGGSPGSGGYSFWLTSEMNKYYSFSHALNPKNNLFMCRYCPGHKTFSVHVTTITNLIRHYERFGLINYLTISKYYVKCMHNYIVFKTSYQLLMKMIMSIIDTRIKVMYLYIYIIYIYVILVY